MHISTIRVPSFISVHLVEKQTICIYKTFPSVYFSELLYFEEKNELTLGYAWKLTVR